MCYEKIKVSRILIVFYHLIAWLARGETPRNVHPLYPKTYPHQETVLFCHDPYAYFVWNKCRILALQYAFHTLSKNVCHNAILLRVLMVTLLNLCWACLNLCAQKPKPIQRCAADKSQGKGELHKKARFKYTNNTQLMKNLSLHHSGMSDFHEGDFATSGHVWVSLCYTSLDISTSQGHPARLSRNKRCN